MTSFVARRSARSTALLLVGCVAFVGLGLWLAGLFGPPPLTSRYSPTVVRSAGWMSVIVFGLCGLGWTRALFSPSEQVRIDDTGVRSTRWSDQTIPWSAIKDISIWSSRGQTVIVLHLRDRTLFPGRGLAAALANANRQLTGGDISISLTGTDRSVEDALISLEAFGSLSRQGSHGP